MLNRKKLQGKMIEMGFSSLELSKAIGISQSAFFRKLSGISDFTREEIQHIRNLLNLTSEELESIFFA